MITQKVLERMLIEDSTKLFVFKQQELIFFKKLLRDKPIGHWLIRESRAPGMISISQVELQQVLVERDGIKTEELRRAITHERYAFMEGGWRLIGGDNLTMVEVSALDYERLHIDSMGDKCQQLLDIFKSKGLAISMLLLPAPGEQSENNAYSHYKVVAANKKRFADPLGTLKQIDSIIEKTPSKLDSLQEAELDVFRGIELLHNFNDVLDLFLQWLRVIDKELKLELEVGLLCPISLDLLSNPHVLESGRVFSRESLYFEGMLLSKCPLTNTPITKHPYRLEGFNTALQSCVIKFQKLASFMKDYVSQLDEKKRINDSNANPFVFFKSSEPDSSGSVEVNQDNELPILN